MDICVRMRNLLFIFNFVEDSEKRKGLDAIMRQVTQQSEWDYREEMMKAAAVFRLDIEKISCKGK